MFGFSVIVILCHCKENIFVSFLHSLVSMLVTAGVVIRRYIQVEEVLQLPLQGLECGSILFVLLPAVHHNVIHDFGAVGGA